MKFFLAGININNSLDTGLLTKNEVFHQGFPQKMWPNPQYPSDLLTFAEEIFNGKLHFLCSGCEFNVKDIQRKYNTFSESLKYIQFTSYLQGVSTKLSKFHSRCTIFSKNSFKIPKVDFTSMKYHKTEVFFIY